MIEFHLDNRSVVPVYMQIVQQVRHALRLALLVEGDQLPTVKVVAEHLAINRNTVLKAYRELERDGLVRVRPGSGTFIIKTLSDRSLAGCEPLQQDLEQWLAKARRALLNDDSIQSLFQETFRPGTLEGSVTTVPPAAELDKT